MSDTHIPKSWPIGDDPPDTRVVEVHMTDGGYAWMLVDRADVDALKRSIEARRLLCGRLIGGAGVNGRGVLIPADRIQMVIEVDG